MSEKERSNKELDKLKDEFKNKKSPRPMGYIFPKRIKDAMRGENPVLVSYPSYKKNEEVKREEGERWTDSNGKSWIMKNGNKLPERRIEAAVPMFCPKCGSIMKAQIDTKFYFLRERCHKCVARDEQHLKYRGVFEEYQEKVMISNQIKFLEDAKSGIEETLNNLKPYQEYINEDGTIEKWKNVDNGKIKEFLKKEQKELDETLEKLYEIEKENGEYSEDLKNALKENEEYYIELKKEKEKNNE